MRIIIVGVGAVGGTLAAALTLAGHEVVGVARGMQLEALQENGLRLQTPQQDRVARFDCVETISELELRADDMILVCVKSHDSTAVFQQLRQAGARDQAIFCAQNGISNEREALRYFPNVHGITVMMPSMYLQPGEVAVFGDPNYGVLDIGGVQAMVDEADRALADTLASANFAAFTCHDIMLSKRSKLLSNLANIVQAAIGLGVDSGDLIPRLQAEAEAVYSARGLTWNDIGKPDPRWTGRFKLTTVPGVTRVGGSTLQSLLRNAGSIETDFLNGEIVLQGRLAGIETPLNEAMTRLSARMLRENTQPGTITLEEITSLL
ncbi:MAG: ketopantoate reductase family protein [Gammaproteobacteria bacterium]